MRRPALAPPDELGMRDGLSYALFVPDEEPLGGVVILHGAGSCKENHFDFGRAARGAGMAAVAFDQRGHGASDGELDSRAIVDVGSVAGVLPPDVPLALRGSSMGGYLALVAADQLDAAAVVAICPASADGLIRGLHEGRFAFRGDAAALEALLVEHPLEAVVPDLRAELLLLHADGDQIVPIEYSRSLAGLADPERSRLVEVPGGDHRSVQHDPELQALALRFVAKALARGSSAT